MEISDGNMEAIRLAVQSLPKKMTGDEIFALILCIIVSYGVEDDWEEMSEDISSIVSLSAVKGTPH